MIKQLIGILAVLLGLVLGGPVAAADLIVSRAMFEDTTGELTINDVATREFTPVAPLISEGFSESAYWLRLQIRRPAHGSKVALNVGPAFLDDIRLYESVDGNPLEWLTRVTGDRHPYDARDRIGIALGFDVHVNRPVETYYLRIKTAGASVLNVEALEPRVAERREVISSLWRNGFIGFMLWALMWALDHFFLARQPPVGLFAVYQAVYILFGLSATGNLAPLIPAGTVQLGDWMTSFLACAVPLTFLLLSRALFRLYAPPAILMRGLKVLVFAFCVPMLALFLADARMAQGLSTILSLIAAWYYVVVALFTRQERAPSRRLLMLVYAALALFTTESVCASLGWATLTSASIDSEWMLIVNGFAVSASMGMLLYIRVRRLGRDSQRAAVALALSEHALEEERSRKEIALLHAGTDYLTGVLNRRRFVELVDQEVIRAMQHREPLSLIMMDIDHFKAVNDNWGHHGGDLVLQKVAGLIRDTLRDVDIFGRMGGEEFAAVLVDIDGAQALDIAQRIRTAVEGATTTMPAGESVRVTLSLGVTELTNPEASLEGLIRRADQALYRAKQAGRNRVMASI